MPRVPFAAAAFLVVLACASSPPDTPVSTRRVEMRSPDVQVGFEFQRDLVVRTDTLEVYHALAWPAVPHAYMQVGLPTPVADSAAGTYRVERTTFRRRLGNVLPSRFLRCGARVGVENADNDDITLSIVTRLVPYDGNKTIVQTQLQAHARPSGVTAPPVDCATTLQLERRIAELVRNPR